MKPRNFSDKEDQNIIYDEEEEVNEMFFILNGTVGIGFHLYQQPLQKQRYKLTHFISQNTFFGDYYICNNTKSEFVHVAHTEIEAFSLTKEFLMDKVFPKYPIIFRTIKNESKMRYLTQVRCDVMKHKNHHVDVVNRRSTYNTMKLDYKPISLTEENNSYIVLPDDDGSGRILMNFHQRIGGI